MKSTYETPSASTFGKTWDIKDVLSCGKSPFYCKYTSSKWQFSYQNGAAFIAHPVSCDKSVECASYFWVLWILWRLYRLYYMVFMKVRAALVSWQKHLQQPPPHSHKWGTSQTNFLGWCQLISGICGFSFIFIVHFLVVRFKTILTHSYKDYFYVIFMSR